MKSTNARGSGVFTLKSFHPPAYPAPYDEGIECLNCKSKTSKDRMYDITNQQVIKYFKKKKKGMPPLLKELYPEMHNEEYEMSKEQDSFLSKKIKVCDTCYIRLADPKNPSQTDRKVAATHPPVLSAPSSPSVASPQSSPSTPKSSFSPSSYTSQTSTPRLTKRGSSSQNSSRKSSLNSFPVNVHTQSHQEAYYLHLYEELDALREEIKSLKSQISKAEANNQLSTDKVSKHGDTAGRGDEINRRDNENIHASEVGIQNLVNQDMIARDEKISNLTVTINELQAKEQTYKDSIGRYKKQQEQEELKHKTQTEHLQGTITLLEKEKQEMQKRMEIMLDGDRAHMLAEIDNMKKRLENEKAQEIHELEESLVADKANMKQQMEKLVKSLGEEKNAKEQMSNQIKDLMKQLDLAKARLKVNQMSDKKTNGAM